MLDIHYYDAPCKPYFPQLRYMVYLQVILYSVILPHTQYYLQNDHRNRKQIMSLFFIKKCIYRSLRNRHEAHLLGEAHKSQHSRDLHVLNQRSRDRLTLAMIGWDLGVLYATIQYTYYVKGIEATITWTALTLFTVTFFIICYWYYIQQNVVTAASIPKE